MARVRKSECVRDWRTSRPYLIPTFIGKFTENKRPMCNGAESDPTRRDDKLPQRYGKGTPTANTPTTDMYGIGLGNASKLVSFATEEGSVNLPCYVQETFYTPSVEALQIITHTEDTRRLPHTLRYYR